MRKRVRYFDLEKIEQGTEPLSPTELEVRERLAYEQKEQILSKLDLEAALKALTPKQKVCLLLFVEGRTESEIAEQVGISQPTAHRLLTKAKAHLKKILQGGY